MEFIIFNFCVWQAINKADFCATDYELWGSAQGIVKKDSVIDGKNIVAGDVLLGLPSSGVHSNGFSLVRRLFFTSKKKKYYFIIFLVETSVFKPLPNPAHTCYTLKESEYGVCWS